MRWADANQLHGRVRALRAAALPGRVSRRVPGRDASQRRRRRKPVLQISRYSRWWLSAIFFVVVYILGKQLTKEKGVPERSALFTPYHLTPGGGERVVLSFLEKIQSCTGQHVDLIVKPAFRFDFHF